MLHNTNTLKFTFAATASLLLSGCQTVTMPTLPNFSSSSLPGPVLPAAQLPSFKVGDLYYYSNGAREQVVSIEGETINLLSRSKRKLSNFRNFALPAPYIEGRTKEYIKESSAPTTAMWPLKVGKSIRFSTDGTAVTKETGNTISYHQSWSCAVDGTERVRVLAGEFDTYRVKCQRFGSNNKWWQNRTWNYAPMLGTYVLRRDFYKTSGERIRQLTALRPSLQDLPTKVRSGIIHAWQTALESKQSGDLTSWTDKVTGTSVQVEPLNTYRAENNLFCRTYKQYLTRKGVTRIYSGVACRYGAMKWRTPARG